MSLRRAKCRGCGERCDPSGRPLAISPACPEHGDSVTVPVVLDKATARALARSARQVEESTAERNRLITEANASGASLREIAEHAGISHVAVLKIIRKHG